MMIMNYYFDWIYLNIRLERMFVFNTLKYGNNYISLTCINSTQKISTFIYEEGIYCVLKQVLYMSKAIRVEKFGNLLSITTILSVIQQFLSVLFVTSHFVMDCHLTVT